MGDGSNAVAQLTSPQRASILGAMSKGIAHEWSEETPEARARWFRSLSVAERIEVLCAFTDMVLAVQPDIADRKDAQQTRPGVRILSRP